MLLGVGHLQKLRPDLLPSSLIIFLPFALVFSTNPPVSDVGTVKYTFYHDKSDLMRNFLEVKSYQIAAPFDTTFHCNSIKQMNGFTISPYFVT